MLSDPHTYRPGGCSWTLSAAGVAINGCPPIGTPGEPVTVRRVLGWFAPKIDLAAAAYSVPPALLVAIICTESAGGQTDYDRVCTARREEPGWISDIATPSRVSIGCCQTLISTARAALQRPKLAGADLLLPATSIRAAAAVIARAALETGYDPPYVAACYNAGGLYPDPSPANRWKLRCYPIGTGDYIDRFVAWYNDAVRT